LLASEMGKIRLSLRGYNDLSDDPQRGATTVPDLLGRSGDSGSDRELNPLDSIRAAGTPRQEGFTEFVQRVANQSNTAEAQTAALRDDIAWTMVLDTPQGPVEYRWRSGQSLPESGASGAPATHASSPATTPSPTSNPSTPEPPEPSTTPSDDEPSDPFTPPTDTDS
jgi:hypothetical protein